VWSELARSQSSEVWLYNAQPAEQGVGMAGAGEGSWADMSLYIP